MKRPFLIGRLAALGLLVLVATGQASATGCGDTSGPPAAAPEESVADTPAAVRRGDAAPPFREGDAVSIQWRGSWWAGRILRAEGERYRVRYDGFGEESDEWVDAARLRHPRDGAAPATTPAGPDPAAGAETPVGDAGALVGTWRYESWTSTPPGGARTEMMNGDVFYWLTLRESGQWTLSSTTRFSPNTSSNDAWGSYTYGGGQLVLTRGGSRPEIYGRYTVRQTAPDRLTLRETGTGDVIVLHRGRS